jgi:enoyl-[acyl-carrier protein] reductase II
MAIMSALLQKLGMTHPVFAAGMARVSQAVLVAAVSDAGGMGCLGGVSFMPAALRDEIRSVRARTSRPFAVNLFGRDFSEDRTPSGLWSGLTPQLKQELRGIEAILTTKIIGDQIAAVLDERPSVLVLTFGTPPDVVDACHQRGIKVMAICGSVTAARDAVAAGVDAIIAQGAEGGGHTSHIGTVVLVPSICDAVRVPVIGAGGIADGRGLAAVLCLGAVAGWCGTRFAASEEAFGHANYKQRLISADARDAVLTRSYTGKNLRTLRNSWTAREQDIPASFPAQYARAGGRVESGYLRGDVDEGMMPAGQTVALIHEILPAGEIVRRLSSEASDILRRRAGAL